VAIPTEMIAGPLTLYVADSGQNFPATFADPPADPWVKLGDSIAEDGVTVTPSETVNRQKTLDSPRTKKLFRAEDDLELTLTLLDLSASTWARVMNGAAVTTQEATGGQPGYRQFTLGRGFNIRYYSLLIRGTSPEDNDLALEGLARYAYIGGGESVFIKGESAGVECNIMLVDDADLGGYMSIREQHEAAA